MAHLKVFFLHKEVLNQGDPLSPFLFILVMEGLNNMVKTVHNNGWIGGLNVAREQNKRVDVTHNMLMTCSYSKMQKSQLKYLRMILLLFETISGLHINGRKVLFPN